MADNLIECKLRTFGKYGEVEKEQEMEYYRLSFYFDYDMDNHHIQFPRDAHKVEVARYLRALADRIDRIRNQ